MIHQVFPNKESVMCTNASQNRIATLANLLRMDCLNCELLLHNLVDIIRLDESLTVNAVLLITDKKAEQFAIHHPTHFEDALVNVRCAKNLRTAPVLVEALCHTMMSNW